MPTHKGRILCTEDDEDTRELLVYVLNMAGYEVICTDSPLKALDMIKAERFDLCLMDNWMPGLSGEDLCKKIREFDSKTPILFYSGAAYDADRKRAMNSGAQGYLVKPVAEDKLIAEVVRVIAESKHVVPVSVVLPDQTEPTKAS